MIVHRESEIGKSSDLRAADKAVHSVAPTESLADGKRGLSYKFEMIPRGALSMVRDRKLKAADVVVLLAIVSHRVGRADSCWTTNGRICDLTGFAAATIPRSIRRLTAVKLIDRVRVGKPDPGDSRNVTGYRFLLNFEGITSDTPEGGEGITRDTPGVSPEICQGVSPVIPKLDPPYGDHIKRDKNKTRPHIPLAANAKRGEPPFAHALAAPRALDSFSLGEGETKGAAGSVTLDFEPFASEAPMVASEDEIKSRASLRKTIAVAFRHGKPREQVEGNLLNHASNGPETNRWVVEEVARVYEGVRA
jgi:hypothetical protein